ncbi:histone-lysine N-methyltransferase SETD1B-like, partial [Paramuricea clavata]
MSHDPSAYNRHVIGDIARAHGGHEHTFGRSSIPNGEHLSRPNEVERKRNYKLIIDPMLKGRGHQKIYRFEGDFDGQTPIIPKDPRSRRTRLWSTRTKADLPVPKFKIDKFYVGIPPQRDVILNGLNDNVDRKFLQEMCEKFGNIEGVKIFYDPVTKRHTGKARVGFTTSVSAKLALAKLDGTSIMGCIVHADFEHKVEVKHIQKPHAPPRRGSDPVHKTPPTIERIASHHVIPTPPPSNSSPANSTPSTPGSLGLVDPRRRNSSASSASCDKHRSKSPLPWPTPLSQNKVPVFEPISPPSEKLPLPPPPPPDGPPPPLPEKCRTPSPIPNTTKQDRYQSKDSKSLSKGSRDLYNKSSRHDDESDWRRRDRNLSRDHFEHSSYRRSSDDRGRDSRDSRYSSHRDYYSRDKDRDSYQRSDPRRYRDSESRRSRDSDDSYGSEKSFKSLKESSKSRHDYESKEFDRGRSPRVLEKDKRDTKKSEKAVGKSEENSQQKDKLNSSDKKLNNGKSNSGHRSPGVDNLSLKSLSPRTEKPSGLVTDVGKSLDNSLQDTTNNYLPMVEDISPVSSPTQPKPMSYPPPNQPEVYPLPNQPEVTSTTVQIEASIDNKVQAISSEDNDDAMSLSSISSNEETLEVTKPVPPVPPPIPTFTPTYAPPVLPPPFMPPYNPSIPPPSYPAIPIVPHRIPIPPLSMATLPPPHPLVPSAFHTTYPPQFVSTLNGVPTPPVYQTFPTGCMPSPHEQRPPVRKNWKIRISEEVLKRVTEELALILKKDVNKRLVENSAFKALDGWWDNAQKSKLKKSTQSETPSAATNQTTTTAQTPDMTSPLTASLTSPLTSSLTSPLTSSFSTTMSHGGMMGMGLRASLPKMPSFRKRRPPSTSGSDLYAKRKRTELSPERGQKRTTIDSDSDVSGKLRGDSPLPSKRLRNDMGDDVSVGSPWQQDDDVTDEPPATSVRTEVDSTLYTNIYSSLSESESSLSGEESASEESGEDDSDWEEGSQGSQGTSDSEEETGKEEDIAERKVPQTPPGTPPESPSSTPAISRTPSNASITPTASPVDVTTIDDEVWGLEQSSNGLNLISQDKEGTFWLPKDIAPDSKSADLSESTSGQETVNKQEGMGNCLSEGGDEGLSEASSIVAPHKHIPPKMQSTSEDSTVENFKSPEVKQGGEVLPVPKEILAEPELPPEFALRPYWQDDRLVYDFLVSGLDYEDACYLNIGFENLLQVGSDSVAKAHWSFHP